MNTTYFYDSDLYGGTVDRIASSIVFSGDMNELDKFCKRWYNRIDSISDEKQRMDVFIHLLVDLSQGLRAKKNIQMKILQKMMNLSKRTTNMVLHTIINEYDILQAQNIMPKQKTKAVKGGLLEYTITPNGKEISRLISTDLSLYLNESYQPFTKLY